MEFLLREASNDRGQVLYKDTELSSDVVTIGSGADQFIQLRGGGIAREHAVFKVVAGRFGVVGVNKRKIKVNGRSVSSKKLRIGDKIEIDKHRIKIVEPPPGFDAACEVSIDESSQQDQPLEDIYVTNLSDTFIGKRAPSYLFSLAVVLAVFVWPFSAYLSRPDQSIGNSASLPIEERLSSEAHKGGGDILWSTGPLLQAHQLEIGDDCSACHKAAFQKVQDDACLDCHQGTNDHFDKTVQTHQAMGVSLCQGCHKEHNEPGRVVVYADTLCVECHQQPIVHSDPDKPQVELVTGFELNEHPTFKLDFLLPKVTELGDTIDVEWYRELMAADSMQEEVSNLKFPHDVHLDFKKVQTLDTNEPMVCSDCHTLKSDNQHFEGITMEKHCIQCHDLTFDIASPDRQLPHGEPKAVVQSIEEYFVRVYTDPNFKGTGKERRRRRPGQKLMSESCDGTSFNCAIERATNEAGIQFTQRGCVTCHEVSDNGSSNLYSRWTVLPVKINHNWYARARFDHVSHLTQQGDAENETCSSCHNAMQSRVSGDVLIPGIDNCLNCHGDQSVEEKVSVNCISCHAFHPKPNLM